LPAYALRVVETAILEAQDKGKKPKAYAELPKGRAKGKKKGAAGF
jgi:hypothetical protein